MLLEAGGWRILSDPTFDEPGRTYKFGWGSSSKKLSGPALTLDALGPIDAVVLSHHHHGDNLDDAGRAALSSAEVVVTTKRAVADGVPGAARGLDAWERTTLEAPARATITVTATPCRHGPPLSRPIVGHVVGFALTFEGFDDGAIWFSGDTVLYPGVREVADRLKVDVAVMHLGAVRFPITGPVRYSMTAKAAVELCGLIKPRVAVPVHYEGWSHFSQGRAAIETELDRAPQDVSERFRLVPIGGTVDLTDA